MFDVIGGDDFEPDGLPDAGGAEIPDAVGIEMPILFAAGLGEIVGIVVGADDDGLGFAGDQCVGDVGVEGGVAALVGGYELVVDVDGCIGVDSAKVEEQALIFFEGGGLDFAAVPDGF